MMEAWQVDRKWPLAVFGGSSWSGPHIALRLICRQYRYSIVAGLVSLEGIIVTRYDKLHDQETINAR